MGNSCQLTKQPTIQGSFMEHQISLLLPKSPIQQSQPTEEDKIENFDDFDLEQPIQQRASFTVLSKVNLDISQNVLGTKKRSNTHALTKLIESDRIKESMKISKDDFVTLRNAKLEEFYKIGKKLGEGTYGCVMQVTHIQTGLIRALKQMKKSSIILEDQQRILSEITILRTLDHPNIVKVHEFFQDDENYYLISEFLSGGELFKRIRKMSQFSERMSADFMRQILRAVSYCHEKNIVHRDLKPENILFDSENTLKLIDFGASRYITQNMNKRLGTPFYVAPEVLQGDYNEKIDIWSAGVIMYILLCGYPPFAGANDADTLKRVRQGQLYFRQSDWEQVSDDAKELICKMLAVDPNNRISAKMALSHPWIQNNTSPQVPNKIALNNLTKFHTRTTFQKAMLSFIVSQTLGQQELKHLACTFTALDSNNDGLLNKQELIQGYTQILKSQAIAEERVSEILKHVDFNLSGQVDYSEFIVAAINQEKLVCLDSLKKAFRMLDLNGDGFLQLEELEQVMGHLGEDLWLEYLRECDDNNDGRISEEEFIAVLVSKF